MMSGSAYTFFISSLQVLSAAEKARSSCGSCRCMSAAEKTLSRYIQLCCSASHTSSTSASSPSRFRHSSASESMGATYLEPTTACTTRVVSSSNASGSSRSPNMYESLASLYGRTSNSALAQPPLTRSSIADSASSCDASTEMALSCS